MRDLKMITPDEYERARRAPVQVRSLVNPGQSAPYFVDYVRQEIEQRFDPSVSRVRGSRIVTTLDLTLQRLAEAAAVRGLDRLESSLPHGFRREPGRRLPDRHARGRAGDRRDPGAGRRSRLSREPVQSGHHGAPPGRVGLQADRLSRALRAGDGSPFFTAASRVEDLPLTLESNGQPWSPRNSDDRYEGVVTVRQALEQSLNSATVRIAQTVGLPTVIELARALGLQSQLAPVPAMALARSRSRRSSWRGHIFPLANGGIKAGRDLRHPHCPVRRRRGQAIERGRAGASGLACRSLARDVASQGGP